jgi:hypothetical protein
MAISTTLAEMIDEVAWIDTHEHLVEGTPPPVQLRSNFSQTLQLLFPDSIRSLRFPSPYLRQAPSTYERNGEEGNVQLVQRVGSYEECFLRELLHFHDCVTRGATCRTPPEQARLDIRALTEMFRAAMEGG